MRVVPSPPLCCIVPYMDHNTMGPEPDLTDPYSLYTREEAAAFLRITPAWLTELTNTGQLYSIKSGRRRFYPRAALTAYIRGEQFDTGISGEDTTTWPPTPSIFAGRGDQ